mmetsp:Transcript_16782/g.38773  ORF Transcript_16782/g.38773 Transcript_16782/m.38773 type:complete len:482 (+) Transcript_16782:150-1595(+)|eukprot:CAMPEP_0197184932 /NCGR_PEP_ID=MMETSP1423-20130617/10892_1 /TAXON_ID=476441 /ORGANISM="Pseudo-nitzschia heimii, Strain UNC1101" /LENGTH=481 /DNA_ID=CAMNT_0042635883 /DNA_START=149 /DNA_END=1594 /DNA_ORIENTATION=+
MTSGFSFYRNNPSIRSRTVAILFLLATSFQIATFVAADVPLGRIVGGQNAEYNEYPFYTSWGRSCGATLIHDDFLLTAAHCNPVTEDQVVVGAYSKGQVMLNSQVRFIKQRFIHPDYNIESWNFDVMLLQLTVPVQGISKVQLNNVDTVPGDRTTVTPLGLGRLKEVDGDFPKVLQEVNVRVINSDRCNSQPMYPGWIQDSMICAGVPQGGQDACFGDSGGPLLQTDAQTGEVVQVGVVSFGTGCARPDKPGVYHRVSSSYDWIQEQICEYSSNKPSTCPNQREASVPQESSEAPITQNPPDNLRPQQQNANTLPPQQQQPEQQEETNTQPPQQMQNQPSTQQPSQQPQHQESEDIEETQLHQNELFTHPENPPPEQLGVCEGDCDSDSDCADGLFCFFKTSGVRQAIPGCSGVDTTSTDFCVELKYKNSDPVNPVRQSLFASENNNLRGSRNQSSKFGTRTRPIRRSSGLTGNAFEPLIP